MLKEILEIANKIGREIDDTLFFTDSNPEHIANFPYHKLGCSKTQPLKITNVGGLPWGDCPPVGKARVILKCSECGGKEK